MTAILTFPLKAEKMTREKVLVVGLGEVGYPIFDLVKESRRFEVYGFDLDQKKMDELKQGKIPALLDVCHVCIPCFKKKEFVDIVVDYVNRFKPKLLIIESTVPPGTTMEAHKRSGNVLMAHSPVRGLHRSREYMKSDIQKWTKYIGGVTPESAEAARDHFEGLGLKTKILKTSIDTELAKLFETTYRAWMIACFQEMHRISKHFGAEFDDTVDFLADTHRLRLDRPVMYPGIIGKHCLIPNIELLLESHDSEFLKLILKSNEKRKDEIKNPDTSREVEKVRIRAEALEKELIERIHQSFAQIPSSK